MAKTAALRRVPIPGTERGIWPRSRPAAPLVSDTDVLLTAWLRPRPGGDLDREFASTLGATLPSHRAYADRKTLARQTDADPADVEALRRYCEGFGLTTVDSRWRSVTISGSLDGLVRAFGATVAIFEDEGQRRFRHRSDALHVPPEIAAALRGVFGLHQWPRSRKLGSLQRHLTPLLASDVAARYQFPAGDGGGQTIAVVQLRGLFNASDFDQCMHAQGLAPTGPIVKRIDNAAVAHEIATTKDLEAALDVQIISSLAPGARVVVYEAPDDERGFLDAVREAIFDEEYAPSVLSMSYGWPEHLWTPVALNLLDELLVAAALVGVSVFCSSGDNGAELDYDGAPHVLAPASSPFAIACGATVIAANGPGAEQAWEKTGGGFSERFDIPPWQDVAQSSAAQYGMHAGRGVPDVAAQQQPGYYVVMDGVELAMGGTSAVAPVWSALTARINQQLGVPIGFFTPTLYQRSGDRLFSDVDAGSNDRFQAGAGWNPCTGLGVPIGLAIEKALREAAP
ncbi:MAG TPA: S53 family peptidase [Candidatus Baltobacteraceae bacterium]|nr:S53 family peptidase [Candidatus Baltobacteraceae bacterium]